MIAGRPVGDNPRDLLIFVDADAVLTVKQAKVSDVVLPQKFDQVWCGHWGRRLPSCLHTDWRGCRIPYHRGGYRARPVALATMVKKVSWCGN